MSNFKLLRNAAKSCVRGCILKLLCDHQYDHKDYLKTDITKNCPDKRCATGIPHEHAIFCPLINDLHVRLKFSDLFMYANELKPLTVNIDPIKVQRDLKGEGKQDGPCSLQMCRGDF